MAKEKLPFEELKAYIPEGSYESLLHNIVKYKVQLTLTRERKTILGTYIHPFGTKGHRITVNANLNQYAFLVTLLHELAHLFTYEKYRGRVAPHGVEWKAEFSAILKEYLLKSIFPEPLALAIKNSLANPGASTCADIPLQMALKKFDKKQDGFLMVDELQQGQLFRIADGRIFERGEKLRTRYKCKELSSKKYYLFSKLFEVQLLQV